MVNFLPSVDDFWVLGNTIYKDYYVYHNPETGVMGWVPTAQRFKSPLIEGVPPNRELAFEYDIQAAYLKLGIMIFMWAATISVSVFIFTTSFSGLSFLNQSSYKQRKVLPNSKKAQKKLVEHLDNMSEASLKQLLQQV